MALAKKTYWKYWENSWTYCYICPRCGFGDYDGWTCNQDKTEYCPKCKKHMFYMAPALCENCSKNIPVPGMCNHANMENPFESIDEDGCRKSCPLVKYGLLENESLP